jgi:hypothetical protein
MGKACNMRGEKGNAYRIFSGTSEVKGMLGRSRHVWDNIEMDLKDIGYEDMDWIDLAQDTDQWRAPVSTIINLRVP